MRTRTIIQSAVAAAAMAMSFAAFAQSVDTNNAPKTRAEVRQELIQIEAAGYNPAKSNDSTYPMDIQAAEARVAAQKGMNQGPGPDSTGYGPATNGTTQSGAQTVRPADSTYFGN